MDLNIAELRLAKTSLSDLLSQGTVSSILFNLCPFHAPINLADKISAFRIGVEIRPSLSCENSPSNTNYRVALAVMELVWLLPGCWAGTAQAEQWSIPNQSHAVTSFNFLRVRHPRPML